MGNQLATHEFRIDRNLQWHRAVSQRQHDNSVVNCASAHACSRGDKRFCQQLC